MNANGMIDTAADYAFVNFAGGDLPTANIDGHPMPLRAGADKNILKAEDVAFLYEGIRDKRGALYGATKRGAMIEPYFHPDWCYSPASVSVALTKKVSSNQMTTLWRYMNEARAPGSYGLRFLKKPIEARPNFVPASSRTYIGIGELYVAFEAEFQGVGAMSADVAAFAYGKPVCADPVLALFEDMKLFSRPCGFMGFDIGGELSDSDFVSTGSGRVPAATNVIVYRLQNYFDAQDRQTASSYAALNVMKSNVEMFAIPTAYISTSSIKLWMLYSAYNIRSDYTSGHDTSTVVNTYDFRGGLIDATQYFPAADIGGMYTFTSHQGQSANLMRAIESLYGWNEQPLGGSCAVQQIGVTYWTDFIVEFTPNGRTKWWSD